MSEHLQPSSDFAALCARVDELVRKRRFRAAYQLSWSGLDTDDFRRFTQAQFLMALTANLTNHHNQALAAQQFASQYCEDNTQLWQGDFERDHALWAIRSREFGVARGHLEAARQRHRQDPNRMACLLMVEARLLYAEGRYEEALRLHAAAEESWQSLGDKANGQWQFNNRVHWLKTLIAAGHHPRSTQVQRVNQHLIDDSHRYGSRQAHLMRRLIIRCGKPAISLDDLLQQGVHRLAGLR